MGLGTDQDPGVALLVGWLLPGAGHWYIARRSRAVLYGLTVVGLFAAGLCMGGVGSVSVYEHNWAFLLQIFDGPLAIAAAVASRLARAAIPPSRVTDLGLTFTLVSAALNVLVMADAYYRCGRSEDEVPDKAEERAA